MQAFYFIVNSRIGAEKIKQVQGSVEEFLGGRQCTIQYTRYGGHATELAREAVLQQNTTVVAVGGDDTVNEVIQVLAGTNIPLAVIPTGSGNGLARHCSIPIKMSDAVKLLINGKVEEIDLGMANDHYFISNAGVGFDAVVCNSIKETKSRGLKMYIKQVIQHFFTYRRDQYVITTDTESFSQKAFFLNVANGREFGYGFQISPAASLQDGLLNVILTHNIHAFNGLFFVLDGWRKRLHKNKNCSHFTTKKIRIEGKNLKYFQTDGDAHNCAGVCEIKVVEKALRLIVPLTADNL